MFIENGVLDLVPFSSKPPLYQCDYTNGSVYYWDSVNESIPYTDFYINNIAYSIQATNACQLCVCTEDGLCYTPTNNNSYNLNFVPYCEEHFIVQDLLKSIHIS
uniref:Uncharacterized protein n=1 Tax=Acrobeloides nanus TaxID=290746 RepID=A0A914E336_9BILA